MNQISNALFYVFIQRAAQIKEIRNEVAATFFPFVIQQI
jgi:hypothetical protein